MCPDLQVPSNIIDMGVFSIDVGKDKLVKKMMIWVLFEKEENKTGKWSKE